MAAQLHNPHIAYSWHGVQDDVPTRFSQLMNPDSVGVKEFFARYGWNLEIEELYSEGTSFKHKFPDGKTVTLHLHINAEVEVDDDGDKYASTNTSWALHMSEPIELYPTAIPLILPTEF